jgi:hypothetical protein
LRRNSVFSPELAQLPLQTSAPDRRKTMRVSADVACPSRRIAGPVVFKVAFLALFSVVILSAPLAAHSQAGAVAARPAVALKGQASTAVPTPATAAPGQAGAANATASGPAQSAPPAEQHSGGGMHQGITVHGHWVIEVRNPDGSLAQRREFENSLQPNGQLGIAALLAGNVTGGGLAVVLNGNSIQWRFSSNGGAVQWTDLPSSSPCTFFDDGKQPGPCLITSYNNGQQPFIHDFCGVPSASYGCSFNLSVAAPTLGSYLEPSSSGYNVTTYGINGSSTVTLTGSIIAAAAGTLTDVETWEFACVTSATAQACNSSTPPTGEGAGSQSKAPVGVFYTLTERNLDGMNGDPPSVTVAAMQSINVSVTLSFQ